MKTKAGIGLSCAAGLALGYYLALQGAESLRNEPFRRPANALAKAPEQPKNIESQARSVAITAAGPASHAPTASSVVEAFPKNQAGKALTRVTELFSMHGSGGKEEAELAENIQFLKNHPNEALTALSEGIDQLSPDHALAQQFLVQFVKELDVSASERAEFLGKVLLRPMELGPNGEKPQSYFVPKAALSALIQSSSDPKSIEPFVRTALRRHQAAHARATLLMEYSMASPEGAQRLAQEFGIH